MKKFLLKVWRVLPIWMQRCAAVIIRPRYQVAVGGIINNEHGQILLCEHTYRRLHSWGLPGGDLKFGEDPMDAIKREILEETGLRVQNVRLLLVENSTGTHHVALTYLCTGAIGTFVPSDEVSNIQYSEPNKLPSLFKEQRITIEKCLAILDSEK